MTDTKKAAAKGPPKGKPYTWWGPEISRQVYDLLAEYGPGTAIIKQWTEGEKSYLQVCSVDATGAYTEGSDPLNSSHVCPPTCP